MRSRANVLVRYIIFRLMYHPIKRFLETRYTEFDQINPERVVLLEKSAAQIANAFRNRSPLKIPMIFVCTHNSRRSHLAAIWTRVMAEDLGLEYIEAYSGGTEVTEFNVRAVDTLERAGFDVETGRDGDNPVYLIRYKEEGEPLEAYSKKFADPANPSKNFVAVMVCSDAAEACPFVPGATVRISITYDDPKSSDGTNREQETYDERSAQIAREMGYLLHKLREQIKV